MAYKYQKILMRAGTPLAIIPENMTMEQVIQILKQNIPSETVTITGNKIRFGYMTYGNTGGRCIASFEIKQMKVLDHINDFFTSKVGIKTLI